MREHEFKDSDAEWVKQCIYCGSWKYRDDFDTSAYCENQEKINKTHTLVSVTNPAGGFMWECSICGIKAWKDDFPPHTTHSCDEVIIRGIIE